MKINLKIIIALALIVVVAFWAINSLRPLSYTGQNLTFPVNTGPVTLLNPSDTPITAQFFSSGSRNFSVSSSIMGVSGSSNREGSGSTSTSVFEFELPPGESTFTVARGTNVNFAATTDARLSAVVQPASQNEAQLTIIAAIVAILGLLYYISNTNQHAWIKGLFGRQLSGQIPAVAMPVADAHGQGRSPTGYGDNRAKTD